MFRPNQKSHISILFIPPLKALNLALKKWKNVTGSVLVFVLFHSLISLMFELNYVQNILSPVSCTPLKTNLYLKPIKLMTCDLSFRHRWCGGHHDSRTEGSWAGPAPGAKHHRPHAHHHRNTEPPEIRQPHLRGLRLHLLHHPHDHLSCLARLLLHPALQIRQRQRPQPGKNRFRCLILVISLDLNGHMITWNFCIFNVTLNTHTTRHTFLLNDRVCVCEEWTDVSGVFEAVKHDYRQQENFHLQPEAHRSL